MLLHTFCFLVAHLFFLTFALLYAFLRKFKVMIINSSSLKVFLPLIPTFTISQQSFMSDIFPFTKCSFKSLILYFIYISTSSCINPMYQPGLVEGILHTVYNLNSLANAPRYCYSLPLCRWRNWSLEWQSLDLTVIGGKAEIQMPTWLGSKPRISLQYRAHQYECLLDYLLKGGI